MKTIGEQRIRVEFNPSNKGLVDQVKQKTAELIDLMEELKEGSNNEKIRLISLAQTSFEEAVMWGVKAMTY